MYALSRSVAFQPGLDFQFPAEFCANCGAAPAESLPQTTKVVSSFFLLGGSELTLTLPVPACRACAPTLGRRPLSTANRIFLCLLLTGLIFTALLVANEGGAFGSPLSEGLQLAIAALSGGSLGYVYWFHLKRPRGIQTSHFQPVRILKLKRGFVQGEIKAIRFGFTYPAYLQAFQRANQPVIQKGLVEVAPA